MIAELFRKSIHISLGLFLAYLSYIGELHIWMLLLGVLVTVGFILIARHVKLFNLKKIIGILERRDKFTGEGAIYYFLGVAIAVLVFKDTNILTASIIVLALGDSIAAFVGIAIGKHKIPFTKDKTFEGAIAGLLAATFGVSFFLPLWIAFLGSLAALLYETFAPEISILDDNNLIPLISGLVFSFLL